MGRYIIVATAFLLFFYACKKDVSYTAARAMVVNASSVNISANLGENVVATALASPGTSGYKDLQPGYINFVVTNAATGANLFTGNSYIPAGKTFSVFVVGNHTPHTNVVFDTLPPTLLDNAYYRFFNFADDTLRPAIYINNATSKFIANRNNDSVISASYTSFAQTATGIDTFKIRDIDSTLLLDTVFNLQPKKAYTFYLSGSKVVGATKPLQLNKIENN